MTDKNTLVGFSESCPLCNGKDIDDLDELDVYELCFFHFWLFISADLYVA